MLLAIYACQEFFIPALLPGHVSHQLNWISDLVRVKDRLDGVNINVGGVYREFLRQQLEKNVPWDQFVRSLLDSEGDLFGSNPAAGYYLRDRGMQQDNIAHTVQIFLGTRLECAMCHNHPFDRWTQKEFYEMTAFTTGIGGVTNKKRRVPLRDLNRMISRDGTPLAGKLQNWRNIVRDSIQFGVDTNGTGKIKLTDELGFLPNLASVISIIFVTKSKLLISFSPPILKVSPSILE